MRIAFTWALGYVLSGAGVYLVSGSKLVAFVAAVLCMFSGALIIWVTYTAMEATAEDDRQEEGRNLAGNNLQLQAPARQQSASRARSKKYETVA